MILIDNDVFAVDLCFYFYYFENKFNLSSYLFENMLQSAYI